MPSELKKLLENTVGLSEEFKSQVAPIFEKAVEERVSTEREALAEQYKAEIAKLVEDHRLAEEKSKELIEQYEQKIGSFNETTKTLEENYKGNLEEITSRIDALAEQKFNENLNDLSKKLDGYFEYLAEEYMADFHDQIVSKQKTEIAESFMNGMKSLFESYNIEAPESVSAYEKRISELEEENAISYKALQEKIDENSELSNQIIDIQKIAMFEEAIDGFCETDKVRAKRLALNITTNDLDEFKSQVQNIVESINFENTNNTMNFTETPKLVDLTEQEMVKTTEKKEPSLQETVSDPMVSAIAEAISKMPTARF